MREGEDSRIISVPQSNSSRVFWLDSAFIPLTVKTLTFGKIELLAQVKQFTFCPSRVLDRVSGSVTKTLTHPL